MNFPGALPAAGAASASATLAAAGHTSLHNTGADEVRAVATKIGTGSSTPASGLVLRGTGAGTSSWGQVILTSDVTGVLPLANGGTGTTSLVFPSGSDTLVGRATTDTLTNKTLTAPILVTPTIASFINANHDHTNAAGGGSLGSNTVGTSNIVADAVTAAKLLNGQLYRHQGGSASILGDITATTNFDISATDVKVQTGSATGAGNNSDTVITFPIAFTNTPLIIAAPYNSAGAYPTWYLVSQSNLGFTFRTGVNVASFCWIAIGI